MPHIHSLKNEIYAQNREVFDLADQAGEIYLSLLKAFNDRKIGLMNSPPHKRIFLFFLARVIKSYSAVCTLCREGYGQDASPLLRSFLETLISVKFILSKPAEADRKAIRFVEYKWVIFRRYLPDLEGQRTSKTADMDPSHHDMIAKKFEEYKRKYGITSERALLTWSGKSTRDMARLADKQLLQEYESAFRLDSRFSHPSIIGDKEYLDFKDDALVFSFQPSTSGVVLSLKRAMSYLENFLALFDTLFSLEQNETLQNLQRQTSEIFDSQKYIKALAFEKSLPGLSRDQAGHLFIQFYLPDEP